MAVPRKNVYDIFKQIEMQKIDKKAKNKKGFNT